MAMWFFAKIGFFKEVVSYLLCRIIYQRLRYPLLPVWRFWLFLLQETQSVKHCVCSSLPRLTLPNDPLGLFQWSFWHSSTCAHPWWLQWSWCSLECSSFYLSFFSFLFCHNLSQLVSSPTHVTGNILDHVLTTSPQFIFILSVLNTDFRYYVYWEETTFCNSWEGLKSLEYAERK